MRTLESQTHFMARTALIGSSSIKACHPRAEVFNSKSDLRASESLTQLKLTAEKMIQEQAFVKTDLQATYSKLEKSELEVRSLENRLQDIKSENAILRVKQQEALKLWEGLESKFCSTKTFCNQLTETVQELALEVQEAERSKQLLEQKLAERLRFYQENKMEVDDLLLKKQSAERLAENWETEYRKMERLHEQITQSLEEEMNKTQQLQAEKVEIEGQLNVAKDSSAQDRGRLESAQKQLDQLRQEIETKALDLKELNALLANLMNAKHDVDLQLEALNVNFTSEKGRNAELMQNLETLAVKMKDLENTNGLVTDQVNKLLGEVASCEEGLQQERQAKETTWKEMKGLELQYQELSVSKDALEKQLEELKAEVLMLKMEHETSQRKSSERISELKENLEFTRKNLDESEQQKLKVKGHSKELETQLESLLGALESLTRTKEELVSENSALKLEIGMVQDNAKDTIQEKAVEVEKLRCKISEVMEALQIQERENSQLRDLHLEKDQIIERIMEEQKCLKHQYADVVDRKASAEKLSYEVRKQAEAQLETKLMELNKHIKEISERNDQEIQDMRTKYENDTKEAVNREEQKAALMIAAMREECELRISKNEELSLLTQKKHEDEHQAQVRELIQNHERERSILAAHCQEESKRNGDLSQQLEKERDRKEKLEMKIKEIELNHLDEIKKVNSDRTLDCSKADNRVAMLEQQLFALQEQLKQEKVRREEYLKVSAKKYEEAVHNIEADHRILQENYKSSSQDMQASLQKELDEANKKLYLMEARCKSLEKEDPKTKSVKNRGPQEHSYSLANQAYHTDVKGVRGPSHLHGGRKVENPIEKGKCDSGTLPTHSKTVTHHEYEVATSDGRKTITRKRTKSTVMFEGQSSLDAKRMGSRKSTRISSQHRKVKPSRVYANTMGDLFGGKSLDPYADDPYAFT